MKEILVFIADNYADWEIGFVTPLLHNPKLLDIPIEGYQIKTFALEGKIITSQGGLKVIPDYSVSNVPNNFELLILTGGMIWSEEQFNLPKVKELVARCLENKILVSAICDAATFLAHNNFLDHIKHTGNSLEHLKTNAPNYKGEHNFQEKQCVADQGIITANGAASLEFALEIIKSLHPHTQNEIAVWYNYFKKGVFPV